MVSVQSWLAFQISCASCRWRAPDSGPFCEVCLSALEPAPLLCKQCWRPHPTEKTLHCQATAFARDLQIPPLFACYPAIGQAHEVLKAWKSGKSPALDHCLLAQRLHRNPGLQAWMRTLTPPDWVVPIPQLTDRRWALGGGSTIRLARHFSRELEIPWLALLEKEESQPPHKQSGLSQQRRLENAPEFKLDADRSRITRVPGAGRRLLLVDDIITTGQTLISAIGTAHRHGYQVSGVLVLGWRPVLPGSASDGQSPEVRGRRP